MNEHVVSSPFFTNTTTTISGSPVHCLVLVSVTLQQGNCVTVRRPSHGSKHRSSVPIRTSNRFSPLSDTLTEKSDESDIVIGDSIVWNVKIETPVTIVQCLPGARAPDITLSKETSVNDKSPVMFVLATMYMVVYRPPWHPTGFIKEFADFLSELVLAIDKVLIVADFSINVNNEKYSLESAIYRHSKLYWC